jgi:hypothetical protein
VTKKVNLFLVGAAKAGTSSLWEALKRHPDIFSTEEERFKEPAFFCEYGRKMGIRNYEALFDSGHSHKYRCDASTAYLASPESAERIYQYNPDAKIIIVLRNPVDRAYSLYNWMVGNGYEWAGSFEHALELESVRSKKRKRTLAMPEYYWNYMYFRSGCYSDQVDRYLSRFRDNVLLLNFRNLTKSASATIEEICTFLGVENRNTSLPKKNKSMAVYDARITFAARLITIGLLRAGLDSFVTSKDTRDWLVRQTWSRRKLEPLGGSTRSRLLERYAGEFASIKERYGIEFEED